jgi:HD-like signal output (HDOD) protein
MLPNSDSDRSRQRGRDEKEQGAQVDLADAFNDLMFGAAALADSDLNQMELYVRERVLDYLRNGFELDSLPKLPATAASLLVKLNDPEIDADELIGLIDQDPSLSAELLKLANSAYFRRSSNEITNFRQAIVTIGFNGLKSMVSNILLKPVVSIKPIYFKMFGQQLWDHSQHCAFACSRLATGQSSDTYNAYLLGLIHDVGKIVIFQLLVDAFRSIDPDEKPRPHVFVKLITGVSRPLSVLVASSWELPSLYTNALRDHARKLPAATLPALSRTLFYGNLLSEAYLLLRRRRFDDETMDRYLQSFGTNVDLIHDIFGNDS